MSSVQNRWYQKEINEMLSEIIAINDFEILEKLFNRILTPREINDISRRLKACKMLEQGAIYSMIRDEVGFSDPIIAKLSSRVGYGFRRCKPTLEKPDKSTRLRVTVMPGYKGGPAIRIYVYTLKYCTVLKRFPSLDC